MNENQIIELKNCKAFIRVEWERLHPAFRPLLEFPFYIKERENEADQHYKRLLRAIALQEFIPLKIGEVEYLWENDVRRIAFLEGATELSCKGVVDAPEKKTRQSPWTRLHKEAAKEGNCYLIMVTQESDRSVGVTRGEVNFYLRTFYAAQGRTYSKHTIDAALKKLSIRGIEGRAGAFGLHELKRIERVLTNRLKVLGITPQVKLADYLGI